MGTADTGLPVRLAKGAYLRLAMPVLARLHLHAVVRRAYRWSLRAASDDRATLAVDGAEATFRTELADEAAFFADTVLQPAAVREALDAEKAVLEDFLACLDDDDVVLDVGAHFGLYACLAQDRLSVEGTVYAVEPHPPNAESLRANLSLNDGPAEAHELALADEDGEASFFAFDGRHHTENALFPHFRGATETTVEARRGDSFVEDLGRVPTVIKIDVEGAELEVLRGLEDTLANPECRRVYCEVHPFSFARHGGTHEDVGRLLEGLGYDTTVLGRKGELTYWVRATRPDRQG